MTIDRRRVLAGMAGLGAAAAAAPAWAQFGNAIQPQSDPWAQVDPYADARNGFPARGEPRPTPGRSPSNDPFQGRPNGFASVSAAEEELEIARASGSVKKLLADLGGPYPDRRVQDAMNQFMEPFVRACDRPHLPWDTVVNRVPQFQAIAFGGGKMMMFPEVIAVSDHPGELAAVLAHEMGHNVFSHGTKKIESAIMLETAMEQGVGQKMQQDLAILGADAKDILLKSYGRENEYEADSYIITLFERVGIHPRHAIVAYDKLMQYYGERPQEDNSLFSTHPGTLDRMRRMAELVRTLPPPGKEAVLPGWSTLKATFPTPAKFRTL